MKPIPVAIVLLAAAGERASLRMWRKSHLDAAGELDEPSVVQRPAAKLLFGVPNAALGAGWYALVAASQLPLPTGPRRAVRATAGVASLAAAAMSAVLAISLVRGRLECVNCWTAHGVNAALLLALAAQRRRRGGGGVNARRGRPSAVEADEDRRERAAQRCPRSGGPPRGHRFPGSGVGASRPRSVRRR